MLITLQTNPRGSTCLLNIVQTNFLQDCFPFTETSRPCARVPGGLHPGYFLASGNAVENWGLTDEEICLLC